MDKQSNLTDTSFLNLRCAIEKKDINNIVLTITEGVVLKITLGELKSFFRNGYSLLYVSDLNTFKKSHYKNYEIIFSNWILSNRRRRQDKYGKEKSEAG